MLLLLWLAACGAPLTDNDRYEFHFIDVAVTCPAPEAHK